MICARPPSSSKATVPLGADSRTAGAGRACGCWGVSAARDTEPPVAARASTVKMNALFMVLLGSPWLLDVEGKIVDDERCLEGGILGRGQVDTNGLPDVRREVERLLSISRARVEVRVGGQRLEEGAGRIPDLHLQGVK